MPLRNIAVGSGQFLTLLTGSTLDHAYSKIIAATVEAAQDHINLADALSAQVIDPLKALERKHEENVKKVYTKSLPSIYCLLADMTSLSKRNSTTKSSVIEIGFTATERR